MPTELLSVDKPNEKKTDQIGKRLFVICENCHWCASIMDKSRAPDDFAMCPNCKIPQGLSAIPIADNETFTFSYSEKHGVELDFMPTKQR